jgi:plastocyanin
MEHHMANGMMTLLAYEGYKPTGPAAAFYAADATPEVPMHDGHGDMPPGMAMETTTGPAASVAMVDDRLVPDALTIATGTTVTWTNKGQDWHSVAALDGSFESGRVSPGESYSFQFVHAGTYQYVCQHHFIQGMTGVIDVT